MSDDGMDNEGLFAEPDNYYKERNPGSAVVEREKGDIMLELAAEHPLWGHVLWNASRVLLNKIDAGELSVQGKRVLELGAGAGLASIACCLNGAAAVTSTDYPDAELIDRIAHNVGTNCPDYAGDLRVEGYLWGSDPSGVVDKGRYDIVILSDLLFNHSQHEALLRSCAQCLAPGGVVIVAFSSHRPWLQHKDLAFFDLAVDPVVCGGRAFTVQEMPSVRMPVMFEADPGDVEIRSTVRYYHMSLQEE